MINRTYWQHCDKCNEEFFARHKLDFECPYCYIDYLKDELEKQDDRHLYVVLYDVEWEATNMFCGIFTTVEAADEAIEQYKDKESYYIERVKLNEDYP